MGAQCTTLERAARPPLPAPVPLGSPAAKSGAAKLRKAVKATIKDLKELRKILKPLYGNPSAAFKAFARGAKSLSREEFIAQTSLVGFTGDAGRLFDTMCNSAGLITLEIFKQHLKTARNSSETLSSVVEVTVRAAGLSGVDAVVQCDDAAGRGLHRLEKPSAGDAPSQRSRSESKRKGPSKPLSGDEDRKPSQSRRHSKHAADQEGAATEQPPRRSRDRTTGASTGDKAKAGKATADQRTMGASTCDRGTAEVKRSRSRPSI